MTAIVDDQWLAGVIGRAVFKIEVGDVAGVTEHVIQHARQQSAAFYYAKLRPDDVAAVRALGEAGMYVVDVNTTFSRDRRALGALRPGRAGPGYTVRDIEPDHHEAVLDIAGTCFRYSRFHLDPALPTEIAHRIKREWIRSYIRKERGDRLLVAFAGDLPVGFLAVLATEREGAVIRVIDLIGVALSFQGRGVGRALVQALIDRHRDQCDRFEVGTQIANVPSVRFYHALGFESVRSLYVLHMHVAGTERER